MRVNAIIESDGDRRDATVRSGAATTFTAALRRAVLLGALALGVVLGCSADVEVAGEGDSATSSDVAGEGIDESATSSDVERTESAPDPGFSVLSSLRDIPSTALEDPEALQVFVADLDAAAEALGLRRPTDFADGEAVADFLGPLVGFGDASTSLFVPFPQLFSGRSMQQLDAFVEEVGFSYTDASRFVALDAPPSMFVVVEGVTARAGLDEVAPGVSTIGDGEDNSIDGDSLSVARPIGRPLRLAQDGDRLALSRSTDAVAAWVDGSVDGTLADDPVLAEVATQLDEESVISAALFASPAERFDAVGIGWKTDDAAGPGATPLGVMVFHYPSAADAIDDESRLASSFVAEALTFGQEMTDLVQLRSLEVEGRTAVAVVGFVDDRNSRVLLELLFRSDGPFAP